MWTSKISCKHHFTLGATQSLITLSRIMPSSQVNLPATSPPTAVPTTVDLQVPLTWIISFQLSYLLSFSFLRTLTGSLSLSLSFHSVKFFSSFLHNIVPMLRNYCIGFASKYMYINIHLYVTPALIMLLFFIIPDPSFLYKLFEGMIGHDFCISCHSLKNLASILHSDYSIKNIKYSNDITIPDLEI